MEPSPLHTLLELPWKKSFQHLMRPRYVDALVESESSFSRVLPGVVRCAWPRIKDRTLLDPFRLGKLVDLLASLRDVPGDIVECGCCKGGSGILMALALQQLGCDRRIHLFDSFEGLPEPDAERDKGYRKGQFLGPFQETRSFIRELGLDDRVMLHRGWFRDTVPAFLEGFDGEIALLHVDCDLYDSTVDCLHPLYPRVVEGGVVVFDDFNDGGGGEKLAVQNYFPDRRVIFHVGPAPQVYLVKDACDAAPSVCLARDGMHEYSFDDLKANQPYLRWLNQRLGADYFDLLRPLQATR